MEWQCTSLTDGSLCSNIKPSSSINKISVRFSQPGDYKVQAIVTNQDNLTVTQTATVRIDTNIIAKLSISKFPDQPVDITKWVKTNADLEFVVPGCKGKWNLVEEQGYAFMDLKNIVGGIGEIIVHDFESFLTDIADYSNITVSKHVRLRVPPIYTYPDWLGLTPDKK